MATQQGIIAGLHAAILSAIRERFPDLATVDTYRLDRQDTPMPACLINLTEMTTQDTEDPGTGQIAVEARFEAHLLVGFKTENAHLAVRELAAALMAFARLNRWGVAGGVIGPAMVTGAWEDDFTPALQQYECMRVEWSQIVWLGQDIWAEQGAVPVPFYGLAPAIGKGHEADYIQLNGETPP